MHPSTRVANFFLCVAVALFLPTSKALSGTYGAGNKACIDWVQDTEAGNDRSAAEQWLLGYLSGVSSSDTVGTNDPDDLLAGVDNYCVGNPRSTLAQAAGNLVMPPGIAIAGLGSSEGELFNQGEMNEICRNSYPNQALGNYPVRWATTTDFKEYSTAKGWNEDVIEVGESFALRAENTLFTVDGVAYDQATGTLSKAGRAQFPGAVVSGETGTWFRHRRFRAKPLCVWGRPNPDLR